MAIDAESGRKSAGEGAESAALEFTKAELEMLPGVFAELGVELGSGDCDDMKGIAERVRSLFEEPSPVSAYVLGKVANRLDAARGSDAVASSWPVAIPAENVRRSTAELTSADQRLLELDPDIHPVGTPSQSAGPVWTVRVSRPSARNSDRPVGHFKIGPLPKTARVDPQVLHAYFAKAIEETPRVAPLRRISDVFVHKERFVVRTLWKSRPDHAADLWVRHGDKSWMLEVKLRSGELELRAESDNWQVVESKWTAENASGLSENLLQLFQGDPDCVRATIETLQDGLEERV